MSRRVSQPARCAARPKCRPDEPAISVLSRSKKAAARPISRSYLGAVHFDDDRVALPTAGADRGAAEPAAAATQLVDQRTDDPGTRGPDRVTERDGAPVHVHVLLVDAQHPQ